MFHLEKFSVDSAEIRKKGAKTANKLKLFVLVCKIVRKPASSFL
jgi:hypothetical protein